MRDASPPQQQARGALQRPVGTGIGVAHDASQQLRSTTEPGGGGGNGEHVASGSAPGQPWGSTSKARQRAVTAATRLFARAD